MTKLKRKVGLPWFSLRWFLAITVFLAGSLVSSAAGAISWTPYPVLANFHDVIFDGIQFWAVGDNGLVQMSLDGVTWTSAAPGPSYNFYGIAHGGGGQYVVVGAGSGGTNVDYSVYVTNNGGLTWSQATVSSTWFNVTFFSVAHGATAGEYVAVGGGGVIRRSTDGGATWSPSPQYWYYYWLSKVIYAPIGTGLYVVVGNSGSILTSNDGGITWTAQYAPGTVFLPIGNGMNLYDVAYANGLLVAVGWDNSTSSGVILTSPDGINWTQVTPNPTAEPLHGVTHGPCGWVAVGANGTVLSSPNGTSWTAETSNTTAVLRRVAYGAGRYVAVGQGAILVGLCADGSPDLADLGDAPDSTNHINKPMTAYTGVLARFPTVFDPATGLPQGPKHLQPKGLAWLGKDVSFEDEADLLPDADGVTNIDPGANAADRDKYDDGVLRPIAIPFVCGQTQFQYTVTSTAAAKLYMNVWIDFNRDGDWDDPIQKCPLGPAITGSYTEWAVQNELITVPGPGTFTFTTPPFGAANPTKGADMWMRITLTDQPIAPVHGADGSGPATGYLYGETEDYLLRLAYTEICGVKFHDLNGNGKQDPGEPGLSDWVIEVKDLNGNFMGFAVTDANGRYCILVPSPGTYTVAEQPQPGWIPTTPSTVTLTVPSQASVNFGNRREEPVGKCDLRITKVANRTTVGSGQQVTYTITVTNVGSTACSGPTTVTETVPPGLTLVSAGGFGWICLGNTCTYLLPIPAGGSVSVTYTFTVTAPPGTRIENCATVSNAADTNPTNNRACAVITVTEKR